MTAVLLKRGTIERLGAVASARLVPVETVLDELLRGWTPTADEVARARAEDTRVALWIDRDVHARLRTAAQARGVSMTALFEEAMREPSPHCPTRRTR